MKKRSLLALLMALAMLLTACGGQYAGQQGGNSQQGGEQQQQPQQSQNDFDTTTLTVAYRTEAANLDPHNNQSLTAFSLEMLVYDRLVEKDSEGNIVPSLATSWEVIDDTTIRFFLRDDVYFSNGEKLTAEDVKYTIERAETLPNSSSFMKSFDGAGTTVVDEYTIDLKLHNPFAPVYNYLASARGSIVCKSAMEEIGSDAYGREPIGSGPLVFSNWVPGDRIELVRNENYWGNKTAYETFIARFISEASSREIELETGGVDVALYIAAGDIARLEENPNTVVYNEPGYSQTMITINQNACPQLQDVRVREAFYKALDIVGIVAAVYGDTAVPAYSIFPPAIMGYTEVGGDEYDPDAAKKLLDDAGFDYSQTFELMTTDDATAISVCEAVKNMWEAVGIKVEILTYDQATMSEKVGAGEYQLQISSSSASSGDPDHALYEWKSATHGLNTPQEIADLIAKGAATYETDARKDIYADIQESCWNYYGEIMIAFSNVTYGANSRVQNLDVHPDNVPNFAGLTFSEG